MRHHGSGPPPHIRLWDSVPPTNVNYCAHPCNTIHFMHMTKHAKLITELETGQSSHLSHASNLGPKKFHCEFLTIVLLIEQCPMYLWRYFL